MKTLKLLIMIASFNTMAQNGISASILQDTKLGFGLDKKHLNDKPTLDLIANVNFEGKQKEYYYFAMQLQYERAELHSGYFSRYGVNALWNFNKLVVDNLTIGLGGGLHMIERHNTGGLGSYSGLVEVSYPIAKKLRVIAKNELLRRPDLEVPKLGYNLSLGVNYKF